MTVPAKVEPERKGISYAAVDMDRQGAGGALAPKTLGDVVAFAQVMARADLALPRHLRGNDGACLAVAMQAMRWEMDPFAVANKSYSVNDRLAYEAQLVAAVVHTRAPITGRPNYIYSGEGATRRCQVICVMADGEEREYTSPTFGQITTKNSPLWKSDPDQQLGYFSIRSWARRHTPEVILGVYTPDEVETFRDVTPGRGTGMRARVEARQAEVEPNGGFSADHVEATLAGAEDAEFAPLTEDAVLAEDATALAAAVPAEQSDRPARITEYTDRLAGAQTWLAIKQALRSLYKAEDWDRSEWERQVLAMAWERKVEVGDKTDFVTDCFLWAAWVSGFDPAPDADMIAGNLRTLETQADWKKALPETQEWVHKLAGA